MQRKLLIISMDFDTTGQLFIDVRSEVLYNMLFGHDITIKVVKLTKMCLNETCSRVHVGEHLSHMFPVEKCMKQECRLKVFENRVLRRIFGPKRDEITGARRKPQEELNELVGTHTHSSPPTQAIYSPFQSPAQHLKKSTCGSFQGPARPGDPNQSQVSLF